MSYITLKCKSCGANVTLDTNSAKVSCTHCGSTFLINELLDEKDLAFLDKLNPAETQRKMQAFDYFKQGENYIYQAEYIKAEQAFIKSIELDDANYRAYFGVVRAKTHNLAILPENDSYKKYAKLALKHVSAADHAYLKNELYKLDLLEKERENLKKQKLEKEKMQQAAEKHKRKISSIITSLLYILVIAATAFAIIWIVLQNKKNQEDQAKQNSNFEITTAADLKNFASDINLLSATIILKNDIDFGGESWSPLGTAATPFKGKFYGGNHTIKNIKFLDTDHAGENYIGFFGYTKNATILGLNLSNATIFSTSASSSSATIYAGLIAGRADDTTIKLCSADENCGITVTGKRSNPLIIGSLVGSLKNSSISNCLSNANIMGETTSAEFISNADSLIFATGGLAGRVENSGISYSYSTTNVSISVGSVQNNAVSVYAGGIIGYLKDESSANLYINFCFFTGTISATNTSLIQRTYVAGIAAGGITNEQVSGCSCLTKPNTFTKNSTDVTAENLEDYSLTNIIFTEEESQIISRTLSHFDNTIWQNTNTLSPKLNPTTATTEVNDKTENSNMESTAE